MAILIDTRIQRFVDGCKLGENEDIISIRLTDIDETFHFDNELLAQNFLNKQTIERVGDKELRNGYFDYTDEYNIIHRYLIHNVSRGKITSYSEEVVNKLSEKELYEEYGYLMDKEHGNDTELLIDKLQIQSLIITLPLCCSVIILTAALFDLTLFKYKLLHNANFK